MDNWRKTGANNEFLSCLKMYLCVFLSIYKAGFPGINVWNIPLNCTHVDEIVCTENWTNVWILPVDYPPVRSRLCEAWRCHREVLTVSGCTCEREPLFL